MADDSKGGLLSRPLAAMRELFERYGQNLFQAPNKELADMPLEGWGSPLQPVAPMGPPTAEPRAWPWMPGQNLLFTPRPDAAYTAADLNVLASYPLARICIENVKDILTSAPRQIVLRPKPGEPKKAVAERAKGDARLKKLNDFFDRPDREHDWSEWLRPLINDMLVGDWLTFEMRKTRGGEIIELARISGEMIQKIIDKNGRTPLAPDPAYAQVWWGVPYVQFTVDQLVYKPRNVTPRNTMSSHLYGYSQTEQLAPEIEIGISRLLFIKAYYDEGSLPGMYQIVPRGTPPEKIAEAMHWMNSELAGNFAARRQIRLIQGWTDKPSDDKIEQTKEALLSDPFDEQHMRRIAYGYGVSPQRLAKQVNRAQSEQMDENAELEGTRPYFVHMKSVVDYVIQVKMGLVDYELSIDPNREPDIKKQADTLSMYVSKAQMTPNESREKQGLDPDPSPAADELGVITAAGFVTLSQQQEQHDQDIATKKKATTVPEPAKAGAGEGATAASKPNGKLNGKPRKPDDEGDDAAKAFGFAGGSVAIDAERGRVELAKSQRLSQRDVADLHEEFRRKLAALGWEQGASGTSGPDSTTRSYSHPDRISHRIEVTVSGDGEVSWTHSGGGGEYGSGFSAAGLVAHLTRRQFSKVSTSETRRAVIHPARLSPRSITAKHALETTLKKNFRKMKTKTVRLLRRFSGIASKRKDDYVSVAEREILDAIAADWERIADAAEANLVDAAQVGADLGLLQLDVTDDKVIGRVNETAEAFAERRAAEMVGMRRTADGELVENPDARWAISETTRAKLREVVTDVFSRETVTLDEVEQAVEDSGIYEDQRATMIARTEIANAQVNANLLAWQESGLVSTVSWETSADHDDDSGCNCTDNEDESPYQIGEVPEFPDHPNCECVLVLDKLVGEEED